MFKLALFTFATSLALTTAASAHKAKPQTFTGTLHTGIVAIGGETTGIEITTDSGTYEVDLHGDKAAWKLVDANEPVVQEVRFDLPYPDDINTPEDFARLA